MKSNLYAALAASILMVSACTNKGSISADGTTSNTGTVFATKVYPSSEGETWTAIKLSSRFYIKGLAVSIKGTCSRGISSIKVGESGVGGAYYSETATCLNDGSFTWSKSYSGPLDVDKTLTLVAFDINDAAMSGATDAVDVHIDNVAPTAPVVTTPASSPFTYNGATTIYSISGSVSADTDHLTGPAGVVIANSGTSWSHDVTLVPASSLDFTYYAWDLAGNQSVGTLQTIEWNPSLSLLASGAISGGPVVDGVSNFSIEGSMEDKPGQATDGVSLFKLDSGFNYITNSARQ